MAYRQPAFMLDHYHSTLPLANIYAKNAVAFSNAQKRAFVDFRPTPLSSFTANGGEAGVEFDNGNTTAGDNWNRAVIPAGHTLAGANLRVIHGTTAGLASFLIAGFVTVPANYSDVIDFDFNLFSGAGRRYWGMTYNLSVATVTYQLGEVWIGTRTQLSADAYVQPGFTFDYRHDQAADDFNGRTVTLAISPPRRRFRLEVLNVAPSGADWDVLSDVIRIGRARPFWYWPPDDQNGGPFLVQVSSDAVRRQENRAPTAGIRYGFSIEMVESLT